ncbi:MAG: FAD binding domain-containing protein [Dehalococcoidales bacterium]|nr:FAD binding domain-containing protein [Dehalococcoidales bacterium]
MKEFIHRNAKTVAEAVAILGEYKGQAAVIAGGTDILSVIKSDLIAGFPQALVNIKTIPGLDYIKEEGDILKIGTLTTLADIASNATVKGSYPALGQAAFRVAAATLRSMGTIGGNLCQRTRCWYYRYPDEMGGRYNCFRKGGTLCYAPSGDNRYHAVVGGQVCFAIVPADTALALSALNATIVTNKRSISIDNFYIVLGTALAPDEIVTEIQVPKPKAGTKQYFYKQAFRRTIDWALVEVGSAITIEGGVVTSSRISLGGVAPMPFLATGASDVIKGKAITEALAVTAGEAAISTMIPLSMNKYKLQISKTLVKRAILA